MSLYCHHDFIACLHFVIHNKKSIISLSIIPLYLLIKYTKTIVITISSLGIAGLPGTATMAVSVVLSGVGIGSYFPLAGGILAIDPILDMGRTMLNVNGSTTTAVIVGKSLKKLDKEVFNGASVSENN